MAWIEGSVWEGGKCYAQVVSTSGERSRERFLSAIENLAALGVPSRRRVLLDLTSASVSDTDSYLAHFGLDERQNRHDVLTFFADGKRILFPAILLAHAIFTPFHKLVPYMVHPTGLDRLCQPTGFNDNLRPISLYRSRTASAAEHGA